MCVCIYRQIDRKKERYTDRDIYIIKEPITSSYSCMPALSY
jgi:hypothetical protein